MHLSARMAFGEAVTRAPGVRTQPLPAALGTNRCIVQLSSGECVSRIQLLLMQRRTHIEQHVQALVIHWQIPSFEYRVSLPPFYHAARVFQLDTLYFPGTNATSVHLPA